MPPDNGDPYSYPGSNTLRNKPGIRDADTLARFEHEATADRIAELRQNPIKGKFDLSHLQEIHRQTFQDVYDWAGQLRTTQLAKGGSLFAQPQFIESEAARLSKELASENHLKGLEKPEFVGRLAHYHAEFNALHPFREGNGRATREFVGQLAREAGYELDQSKIDNSKDQWNKAARASFAGDLEPVKKIFDEAVRPARSVAFETQPTDKALAAHPELAGAYALAAAIDKKAEIDGMTPQQRGAIGDRVRQNLVKELDAGRIPKAQTKEAAKDADRADKPRSQEPER